MLVEILAINDGGKGVISAILPDELMPVMVDKASGKQYRVEVIMNPFLKHGGCKIQKLLELSYINQNQQCK